MSKCQNEFCATCNIRDWSCIDAQPNRWRPRRLLRLLHRDTDGYLIRGSKYRQSSSGHVHTDILARSPQAPRSSDRSRLFIAFESSPPGPPGLARVVSELNSVRWGTSCTVPSGPLRWREAASPRGATTTARAPHLYRSRLWRRRRENPYARSGPLRRK